MRLKVVPSLLFGAVCLLVLIGLLGCSSSTTTTTTTPPTSASSSPPATTPATTGSSAATTTASGGSGASGSLVAQGESLSVSLGCRICHSIDGSTGVGPTWKGLAGSQVALTDGTTVTADDAYLTTSIENPDKQIVQGFQPGIMSAKIAPESVGSADVQALVAYIDSLK
jgi:cytochrome c oxidase subunit 2